MNKPMTVEVSISGGKGNKGRGLGGALGFGLGNVSGAFLGVRKSIKIFSEIILRICLHRLSIDP